MAKQNTTRNAGRRQSAQKRGKEKLDEQPRTWKRVALLAAILFCVAVVVYVPAMRAGFIWDDDQLLTANPHMKSSSGLYELWVKPETADYFPLTLSTLWVEWQFWGENPAGYHVVNIALHAIDAILMWAVLVRLRVPGAWFAALLFAVHPVNAESVAWVSERKNTLSMLFYLLTFLAFFRFERSGRWSWYGVALVLFAAALTSKTSVVMVPVVLLMCAWWQREKIVWSDLLRTLPFFALSALMGAVTIWFQYSRAIAGEAIPIGGIPARIAGAGMALWFYLSKAVVPVNLTVIYARWNFSPPTPAQFLPILLWIAMLGACWYFRRRIGKGALMGLGYFTVTLLPVLGLLKMSYMRLTLVADHFQYLAHIGVVAMVVGYSAHFFQRAQTAAEAVRPLMISAATAVAVFFAIATWEHAAIHVNEELLWRDTLEKNPNTWQAHNRLGAALYVKGEQKKAAEHFAHAVRLNPGNAETQNNYGLVLANAGRSQEAIQHYRRSVKIRPDIIPTHVNLANALRMSGANEEAVEILREAEKKAPQDANVQLSLGLTYLEMGRPEEAIAPLEKASQRMPQAQDVREVLETAREKARRD